MTPTDLPELWVFTGRVDAFAVLGTPAKRPTISEIDSTVGTKNRFTICTLEAFLHQHGTEPTPEFETNLAQMTLVFETETFVQGDRCLGTLIANNGDDFFDPSGHRLELAANTAQPGMLEELHRVAPAMLDEWDKTKRAPQHAAWLHDGTHPFNNALAQGTEQ